MDEPDLDRAITAASTLAERSGLRVDDAVVLQNSNKLTLRLSPCATTARVAHVGQEVAALEVDVARRLAVTASPVAALDPRVEPRPHELDGFVVTFWTYHEPVSDGALTPRAYADALARLHTGMRSLNLDAPHFTARVDEARTLVDDPALTPDLDDDTRELLGSALRRLSSVVAERDPDEQLLHGEPHAGNVLATREGPVFVDLETCCRGPVEFDLAHVPVAVVDRYPSVDADLLDTCRGLTLAMVAAWRFDRTDQFPDGRRSAHALLAALRAGPPWPALDDVMPDR